VQVLAMFEAKDRCSKLSRQVKNGYLIAMRADEQVMIDMDFMLRYQRHRLCGAVDPARKSPMIIIVD
jgi:hypothetical protein